MSGDVKKKTVEDITRKFGVKDNKIILRVEVL